MLVHCSDLLQILSVSSIVSVILLIGRCSIYARSNYYTLTITTHRHPHPSSIAISGHLPAEDRRRRADVACDFRTGALMEEVGRPVPPLRRRGNRADRRGYALVTS